MMRLHLVVLGGRSDGCHVELHDVRFVAAASIEAAIPELRRQWFGRRRGLHMDSYVALDCVDGHRIELRPEPWGGPERLWFVNMGAYDPSALAELHQFTLVVAPSAQAAKARARRQLLIGAVERHSDDLHLVEDCLQQEALQGWHVHLPLDPEGRHQPLVPDWFGYRRIDRDAGARGLPWAELGSGETTRPGPMA
jgi:hypothetical protein